MGKVRCRDCGFLAVRRNEAGKVNELGEAWLELRESGEFTARGNDEVFRPCFYCFVMVPGVQSESTPEKSKEGIHVPNDPKASELRRNAASKERECDRFTAWRQGFSPKEHAEMLYLLERDREMREWHRSMANEAIARADAERQRAEERADAERKRTEERVKAERERTETRENRFHADTIAIAQKSNWIAMVANLISVPAAMVSVVAMIVTLWPSRESNRQDGAGQKSASAAQTADGASQGKPADVSPEVKTPAAAEADSRSPNRSKPGISDQPADSQPATDQPAPAAGDRP